MGNRLEGALFIGLSVWEQEARNFGGFFYQGSAALNILNILEAALVPVLSLDSIFHHSK